MTNPLDQAQHEAEAKGLPRGETRAERRERNRAAWARRKEEERAEARARARARAEAIAPPSIAPVRKDEKDQPPASRNGILFEPTAEQRRLVQQLAGVGCTRAEIIAVVPWSTDPNVPPISVECFEEHLSTDYAVGKAKAGMTVKKTVYDMATSGDSLAAAQYYLKAFQGVNPDVPQTVINNNQQTVIAVQAYLPQKTPLIAATVADEVIEAVVHPVQLPSKT